MTIDKCYQNSGQPQVLDLLSGAQSNTNGETKAFHQQQIYNNIYGLPHIVPKICGNGKFTKFYHSTDMNIWFKLFFICFLFVFYATEKN